MTQKKGWLPARVPGCVHTDLRRNKLIPDPFWGSNEWSLQWIDKADWIYRCEFAVTPAIRGRKHVELVCDGLDTLAVVRLARPPAPAIG